MFGEEELVQLHKKRLDIIGKAVILAFSILLLRLWYLQVYRGKEFFNFSIKNSLRKESIPAPRGNIYTRDNHILVSNTPRFDVVVTPQFLTNKKLSLKNLSMIINMPVEEIEKKLKRFRGQARYLPVRIKTNLSEQELSIIETENFKMPGVSVQVFIGREYRDPKVNAHLLGYVSEISQYQLPKYRKRDNYDYQIGDFIGQVGIEERYDLYLRGKEGYEFVEVDARGRQRRHVGSSKILSGIKPKEPDAGNNIRLTIDNDLQKTAYEALEGKQGSAVVLDVKTGEVLAMVSRPSYDPSAFSKRFTTKYWNSIINNDKKPMLNRVIQEHYAPASTFKTITALAALEEKLIDPDKNIYCDPSFKLGNRTFHDWKPGGHGLTNVYKSLRESVDVYYYIIGMDLEIDKLSYYAREVGLGTKTGIRLSREVPGLTPTREWKKKRYGRKWRKGDMLSCVIGQSYFLVTPLQLAVAYSAIANDGHVYRPYIVQDIFSNSGEKIKSFKPELIKKSKITKENFAIVRKALYEVVHDEKGTVFKRRIPGVPLAGKTGTAQVRSMSKKELFKKCSEKPYSSRHHGLFAGFLPYNKPQIAIATVIEHGCSGSGAAAPVAMKIGETYMKKYLPDQYETYLKEDKQAKARN